MALRALLALSLSVAAMAASLLLAWHHPLWPVAALLGCGLWSLLSAWQTGVWQFALPVGAVALNFSPWTGWLAWSELDMLVLASLAGAYAQRALTATLRPAPLSPAARTLLIAMAGAALLGLLRGWLDADPVVGYGWEPAGGAHRAWDWFAGYTDAANSLRVAKSELYALLILPLWPRRTDSLLPLARGMVAALAVVVSAVLWERLAFPGLWNFDAPYRSVALFWEMHVGGEALDGFLALATPFAVWAVLSARGPWAWSAAATLAVLTLYAVLTSFARGVYAATLVELTVLALLLLRQRVRLHGWRARGTQVLILLLVCEVALVVWGGGFMWQRMAATQRDLGSRVQHWKRGLATLQHPGDWLLGLGVGRLPSHYAASGPDGEFSGAVRWNTEVLGPAKAANQSGESDSSDLPRTFATPLVYASLSGPPTRRTLGGQFALTQRTASVAFGDVVGTHSLLLKLRVRSATELMAQWCERHLLFDGHCQTALLRVLPSAQPWQSYLLLLQDEAPPPAAGPSGAPQDSARHSQWHPPRPTVFTLSVVNAGATADLALVQLQDAQGHNLLQNADFQQGLAHWWGTAQSYFLPWHIDNLVLELLIERGLLGLLLFGLLLGIALWRLTLGAARHGSLAPYQAAALLGTLCVGLSGSLLDVPRVALMLYLLALDGLVCERAAAPKYQAHAKSQRPKSAPRQTGPFGANEGFGHVTDTASPHPPTGARPDQPGPVPAGRFAAGRILL